MCNSLQPRIKQCCCTTSITNRAGRGPGSAQPGSAPPARVGPTRKDPWILIKCWILHVIFESITKRDMKRDKSAIFVRNAKCHESWYFVMLYVTNRDVFFSPLGTALRKKATKHGVMILDLPVFVMNRAWKTTIHDKKKPRRVISLFVFAYQVCRNEDCDQMLSTLGFCCQPSHPGLIHGQRKTTSLGGACFVTYFEVFINSWQNRR